LFLHASGNEWAGFPYLSNVTVTDAQKAGTTVTNPNVQNNSKNVLGNVTSIIGSLSSGVSSVFNALAFKKQAEMANQANLNDRRNNWTIWLVGGAILLVVVLILIRKK